MHNDTSGAYDSVLCQTPMHTMDIVHHLQRCPGAGCLQGPALLQQRGRTQQHSKRETGCLSVLLPQPEPETAAAAEPLCLLLLLHLLNRLHLHKSSKETQSEETRKKYKRQCHMCGPIPCTGMSNVWAATPEGQSLKQHALRHCLRNTDVLNAEQQRLCLCVSAHMCVSVCAHMCVSTCV